MMTNAYIGTRSCRINETSIDPYYNVRKNTVGFEVNCDWLLKPITGEIHDTYKKYAMSWKLSELVSDASNLDIEVMTDAPEKVEGNVEYWPIVIVGKRSNTDGTLTIINR